MDIERLVFVYLVFLCLLLVFVMRGEDDVDCTERINFRKVKDGIPILLKYVNDRETIETIRSISHVRGFDKTRLVVHGDLSDCVCEFLDMNGIVYLYGDHVRDHVSSLFRMNHVIHVDSGVTFSEDALEFFGDLSPSMDNTIQCISLWNPHGHLLSEMDDGVRLSSSSIGVVWMGVQKGPCIIPNVPRVRVMTGETDTDRFFTSRIRVWNGIRSKRILRYDSYFDGLVRAMETSHHVNDLSECKSHGSNVIWISTGDNGWSVIGLRRKNRGDFFGLVDVSVNGRRVLLVDILSQVWSRFRDVETHIFNVRELVSWRKECNVQP